METKNMVGKVEPKPPTNKLDRRRGRPAGKNRVPLSLEERRARNALYERERRNETGDAMAQLAEAACCDPQISNSELLATVISQFRRATKRTPIQSIEDLMRVNENLESQIAALQSRLESDAEFQEAQENTGPERIDSQSESGNNESESSEIKKPRKLRKKTRASTIHGKIYSESSSPSDSSSSADSDWSNHHLGKTLPTQETIETSSEVSREKEKSETGGSTPPRRTETLSPNSRPSPSISEHEFYSDISNQSEVYPDHLDHQDVKTEFHSDSERNEFKHDQYFENSSQVTLDPFTDSEKGILVRLNGRRSWHLDFDDFLTGY